MLRENGEARRRRGNDELRAFDATRTAFGPDRTTARRAASSSGSPSSSAPGRGSRTAPRGPGDHHVGRAHEARAARRWPRSTTRASTTRAGRSRAYARLSALRPERSSRSSGWTPWPCCSATGTRSISVLGKKSEMASDEENASICRHIAGAKLEDARGPAEEMWAPIQAYERSARARSGKSAMTIDPLIELHEPRGAARGRLVELYGRRIGSRAPDGGAALRPQRVRRPERYERDLSRPARRDRGVNAGARGRSRAIRRCWLLAGAALPGRADVGRLLSNLMLARRARPRTGTRASASSDSDRRPLRGGAGEPERHDHERYHRLVLGEDAVNDHAIRGGRAHAIGEEPKEELAGSTAAEDPPTAGNPPRGRPPRELAWPRRACCAQTEADRPGATLPRANRPRAGRAARGARSRRTGAARALWKDAPDGARRPARGEIERLAQRAHGLLRPLHRARSRSTAAATCGTAT